MGGFRRLDEARVAELDDAALIAYAVEARRAGEREAALAALRIFAFGMEGRLLAFVRARLDSAGEVAIEEVAERTLEDALVALESFAGGTEQEARAFVFRIARRRIADFHRASRPASEPIDAVAEAAGPTPAADALRVADDADLVGASLLIEELLAELRDDHRRVVEMNVLSGYPARETVEAMRSRNDGRCDDSLSEQNVHQIASRFRGKLRARLREAGEVSA